jgi:anti-anti-sigma factor
MVPLARITSLYSGSVLVQLSGELDLVCVPVLSEQFACALRVSPDLVVDLQEVSFLDAAVIATFLQAQQRALTQGGSVILIKASPWVEKVLRAARATEAIPLLPRQRSASSSHGHQDESLTPA